MSEADDTSASDTLRGRASGSRLKYWLLLEVERHVLAAVVLAGLFVGLVVVGHVDPTPLPAAVESTDPIETAFQSLLTGLITGVTLVVTINQLVLSQELGPLGDQRERMAGALEFREDVTDVIEEGTSPADPSVFMIALLDAIERRALAVEDAAPADEEVSEFVDDVAENAREVRADLEGASFGSFNVLSATLDFNYSLKIVRARRLADGATDDAVADALDDLDDALEFYGPSREHIKTLYFQWSLIDLSRSMLYAAIPALLASLSMIFYVNQPGTIVGTTLGVHNLIWVAAGAATLSLVPFVLLFAYILRIATIARRTLAIGPFVLRSHDRDD